MKTFILILTLSLCAQAAPPAQKRKPTRSRARTPAREPAANPKANAPRVIGSPIVVMTKNGERIEATLVDLTAYSVRFRSGTLESTVALDTVSSISFGGDGQGGSHQEPPPAQARPEFMQEAQAALQSFQSMATELKNGADYTEFDRLLVGLRRSAERVINKYSASENASEARVAALLFGALTDYTWARTIWTLRFGRSGDGTVSDSESPVVADTVALYSDLRAAAASGNKFSVDKLVAGLWKKAADKTDRARAVVSAH